MLEANDDEDRHSAAHHAYEQLLVGWLCGCTLNSQNGKHERRKATQDPAPPHPQATAQGGPQPVAVCEETQEPTTQHDPLSGRFSVSFSFFLLMGIVVLRYACQVVPLVFWNRFYFQQIYLTCPCTENQDK